MSGYTLESGRRHETTTIRCPECRSVQVVGEDDYVKGWMKDIKLGMWDNVEASDLYCSIGCYERRIERMYSLVLEHASVCSQCRLIVELEASDWFRSDCSEYEYVLNHACMMLFEHGHLTR